MMELHFRTRIYAGLGSSAAVPVSRDERGIIRRLGDCVAYALGEFRTVSAIQVQHFPQVRLIETGTTIEATSANSVAVGGILEGGALASIHMRGGRSPATNLLWEINGSDGAIRIMDSGDPLEPMAGFLHLQAELLIEGSSGGAPLRRLIVPDRYFHACRHLPDPAFNIAQPYNQLAGDVLTGGRSCPGFDVAVKRHRFIEAVRVASNMGARQSL